jgi:E3 ubiquitin-protein ligase RNF115/126
MSEFLRDSNAPRESGGITGTMMAQYLMSLIGGRGSLGDMLGADSPGRMGDYVFNQQALDEIITQLMESGNSSRPVPATEDTIENLPREVLEAGSPTLEKDCAVCKEQFKLDTEDSDELVVLTLPCKHPFHEGCILPWLKSSGTCPVCRYALVPQPEYHGPAGTSRPTSPNATRSRTTSPSRAGDTAGILSSFFGFPAAGSMGTGSSTSSTGQGSQQSPTSTQSSSQPEPSRRGSDSSQGPHRHVPGSWEDDLD